jgi:uncharacterized repeat protein (TIGR02543 family)
VEIGQTIGHEFGHYAYGLFDEYREEGSTQFDKDNYMPHSDDVPCDSIMNNQYSFQEFCINDKHHSEKTAQHRVYKSSCWDTLVRDPKDDPKSSTYRREWARRKYDALSYPQNVTNKQTGGDDELQIVYMEESRAQVVLIIDRSGSMYGQKIEDAKAAAKQFVDLLQIGDKISVVSFSTYVTTTWSMSEIAGPPPQTSIKRAIDNIYASGVTAMGDAMRTALSILINQADRNFRRTAVLLSNGWHNYGLEHPNDVVPDYISEGIPIFAIALGSDADTAIMEEMAKKTGGSYYFSPIASELKEIYAAITQQTSANEQLMETFKKTLAPQESVQNVISVDSTVENVTFLVSWDYGDSMLLELVTPAGQVISPTNVYNFPNVFYAAESTYALYRVQTPVIGNWIMQITAKNVTNTGNIAVQVQAVADIHLSVSVDSVSICYPEPIGFAAALRKNLPIINANVTATITAPDGSKFVLDIKDNGESPDFAENDGIYSGVYSGYEQNGEYEILVTATNPNLNANESDQGALEQGDRKTVVPIGEQFKRTSKVIISVNGVIIDDHGNSPREATPIQPDNSPIWGNIEQRGDVDFFKFDAIVNNKYTIRTSQLIAQMDSFITLYDQDESTVISQDDNNGGGLASMIIWTAPKNGTYYVKVEHAIHGTGTYQLTVGFTKQWEIIYKLTIGTGNGGTTDPKPGSYNYSSGTEVIIKATPNNGYRFNGWSGDVSGTTNPISITMNSNKSITANFIRQYTLTVAAGTGGTTNPSPGTYTHDSGTQVSITAIPNSGYQFSGWNGAASGTTNPITLTMDNDKSVTASFTAIPKPPEEGKKGGCFIATAAYGSPLHPYVNILRDFRDKYLMTTKLGRVLVGLYYKYSPSVADLIAKSKMLKVAVRINLLPLVVFIYLMLRFGPITTAVMLGLIFALPIFFVRFYRRR